MNLDMPPVVGSPIVDVIFEKERILVALEDGRLLAAPPTWAVPKVAAMGPLERSKMGAYVGTGHALAVDRRRLQRRAAAVFG
ncbi:hypothetical protein H9K76_00485 [Diaphorobacter ruginosibacter]|uniref:Uncharacterized protein n=1 Tax=Diaphorobacter ruginosibacter TaxID=1715720 RepID=A0A7G9RP93_9BURK|nr:hypothetical protein [Diaphorobacter ruginosibacter]QNN57418.1 hypothetical protein H9K76_00485 [Diaphorobacter ruginosibacter]